MEKQTLTVPEAAKALGIHPVTLYSRLKRGEISMRYIRLGRRILIPQGALDDFLASARAGSRRPGRPKKGGAK